MKGRVCTATIEDWRGMKLTVSFCLSSSLKTATWAASSSWEGGGGGGRREEGGGRGREEEEGEEERVTGGMGDSTLCTYSLNFVLFQLLSQLKNLFF